MTGHCALKVESLSYTVCVAQVVTTVQWKWKYLNVNINTTKLKHSNIWRHILYLSTITIIMLMPSYSDEISKFIKKVLPKLFCKYERKNCKTLHWANSEALMSTSLNHSTWVQGKYSQKVLELNLLYKSIKVKPNVAFTCILYCILIL